MYVSFHYLLYFIQMRDKKLLRIALRYLAIYLDIDPKEIDKLEEKGFTCCAFGRRILRTETAPLYALSAISYELELKK